MCNLSLFFRGGFGGSDIHLPIYLHGIRADDFTAELSGKFDADSRFTDSGRAADDNYFRFVVTGCIKLYFQNLRLFSGDIVLQLLFEAFINKGFFVGLKALLKVGSRFVVDTMSTALKPLRMHAPIENTSL